MSKLHQLQKDVTYKGKHYQILFVDLNANGDPETEPTFIHVNSLNTDVYVFERELTDFATFKQNIEKAIEKYLEQLEHTITSGLESFNKWDGIIYEKNKS